MDYTPTTFYQEASILRCCANANGPLPHVSSRRDLGTSIAAIAYLHIIYLIYVVYLIYLDTPFKLMEILPSRLGTHVS